MLVLNIKHKHAVHLLLVIVLLLIFECNTESSIRHLKLQTDEIATLINGNSNIITKNNQKRSLTAADATNSIVGGLNPTNVFSGAPLVITVTAKDSTGNLITTGGEFFTVKISNLCTKNNNYFCVSNGATTPLSSNINGVMTDHNNGTYTYSTTLTALGSVSVNVYCLTQNGVFQEYYSDYYLIAITNPECIKSGLSFNSTHTANFCQSSADYIHAKIITAIKSPITGSVKFYLTYDDGLNAYLDDVCRLTDYTGTNQNSYEFTANLEQDKYYTFYGIWKNSNSNFDFSVGWSYGTQVQQFIPDSYLFLPALVSSSPYSINVIANVCGDGYRTSSEVCDDGNSSSGDGCSSSCTLESGYSCTGGTTTTSDVCSEVCGDGKRFTFSASYCDDGNTSDGDGCSSTCSIETGFTCSGGSSTAPDICSETCGDGKRYSSLATFCDDGNTSNGDGCSATCSVETGWTCSGGTSTTPDTCTEVCGDGKRFNSLSTYCDDGNTSNGDGCSLSCSIETGWICSGGTSTTPDSCSENCGDGKRFNSLSTYCDDGNTSNGDGCSSTCSVEIGFTCSGGSSTAPDVCSETCGDGKRYSSLATFCDDGNTSNGDGCSSTCSVEIGFTCSGGSSTAPDVCSETCGDGKRYSSLATFCDDGNTSNGDGCNSSCSIETGWTCSGGTTSTKDTCSEICGDGKQFNTFSTYCDDGNTSNNDGCNSSCLIEAGWNCSGGSSTTKNTCTEICGDSKRFNTISTYCDDGNISSSDGCNATCQVEIGWTCSGGTTSSQDTCTEVCGDGKRFNTFSTYCDDGNTSNNDGCNSLCLIEAGWNCSGGSSTTKDTCTEICGDGIKFNILTTYCDDANTLNGDGCNSSCNAESGWKCTGGSTTSADSCYDICGDGINMTPLSSNCDDGNLLNNDGCNTNCKVEVGWNCLGGSKTSIDICKEICGDGIRFNSLPIYCDDNNTANGDGCNSTCNIETGWTCKGGSFSSSDSCTEICGDGVRFNTLATYCDDGNTIDNDGCSSSCQVESRYACSGGNSTAKDICAKTISAQEEDAIKTLQIIAIIGATISSGTSLLTMSSPIGIFSMINQYQLLFLLLICGVYLSNGVKSLIIGMEISLINFEFIKLENASKYVYFKMSLDQSNELLVEIGVVSGSTFINIFKLILMILIIFLVHLFFIPIYCKCRDLERSNICRRIGEKIINILTFSIYIRLILESYIVILFSVFGEIYQFRNRTKTEAVSFGINIVIAFIITLFYLLCVWQIKKAHPVLKQSKQIYFTEFFAGLKDSTYSRLYPTIFMGQRILSCFLVVILANFGLTLKVIILAIIQTSCLVYLLLARPYEKAKDSFIECMSQLIMVLLCCILIRFNSENYWNSVINWIFIGTLLLSSAISTLISFTEMVIKITIYAKKLCCGESRIENYKTDQSAAPNQTVQNTNTREISRVIEEQKSQVTSGAYPSSVSTFQIKKSERTPRESRRARKLYLR